VEGRDVEVVRSALDAFNRRDRDAFLALTHEDAEIVPLRAAVEDTIYRGEGAAERFWDEGEQLWERLRVDIEELRQVGDRVLATGRLLATARGSGVPVQTPVGFVFAVRDGKLAFGRTYTEPDEARAAVGDAGA